MVSLLNLCHVNLNIIDKFVCFFYLLFDSVLRGVGPGCNTREIADKLIDLKAELDDLALREDELDQQRVWVQQSIKNVTDDSNNSPYPCCYHLKKCYQKWD